MMNEENKKEIIVAINQRIGKLECPICHLSEYTFLDGYFVDAVQDNYRSMRLGGRMLPSVVLVCNHCGHIDKFSLGVLGLLSKNEESKNSTNNVSPEDNA